MQAIDITMTILMLSLVFSVLALIFSINNYIECKAMQKSTHSIQYVDSPFPGTITDEDGFESITEETKEKVRKTTEDLYDDIIN